MIDYGLVHMMAAAYVEALEMVSGRVDDGDDPPVTDRLQASLETARMLAATANARAQLDRQ